jgi:BRCT domain type II-containing protein
MIVTNPSELRSILMQGTKATPTTTNKTKKEKEVKAHIAKTNKTLAKGKAKPAKAKPAKAKSKKATASSVKPSKPMGIGAFCIDKIAEGLSNAEVFAAVQKKFPSAATSMNCIRWYRSKNFNMV